MLEHFAGRFHFVKSIEILVPLWLFSTDHEIDFSTYLAINVANARRAHSSTPLLNCASFFSSWMSFWSCDPF